MKRTLLPLAAVLLLAAGCIKVDGDLGKGLIDKSHLYETYTVEFPLTNISVKKSSDLTGFSSSRVVIGAIRDDDFGLTTRESAFTLVPYLDTLDLGTNPKAVSFDLCFASDTVSCADDSMARILQNIYVTELTQSLDVTNSSTDKETPHGTNIITNGLPVYNGSGNLSFSFKKEFAQKYIDAIKALAPDGEIVNRSWDSDAIANRFKQYTAALPGIHIATDVPSGNGGRINLFSLSSLSVSSNQFYLNDNIGILRYTNDDVKDTLSVLLFPGEMGFLDEAASIDDGNRFAQYAFNRTTHESAEGTPATRILVEGGGGIKPVISAKELQEKTLKAINDTIAKYGGSLKNTVITKATIVLPFEMTPDYRDMKYFPGILSPTIRRTVTDDSGNETIQFAGLTDASVSTEDQGDIDRSNLVYSPDITYHLQELLTKDLSTATDSDIWLLTIFTEQVATATSQELNDYYQQMAYAMYYQSLYGGGYGGYGGYGYGGYGYNSYSNYYSYAMMAAMYGQMNSQQYTTNTELDKDRYYKGILCGPADSRPPYFRVSFALAKD